jgi:hypothetical protein
MLVDSREASWWQQRSGSSLPTLSTWTTYLEQVDHTHKVMALGEGALPLFKEPYRKNTKTTPPPHFDKIYSWRM